MNDVRIGDTLVAYERQDGLLCLVHGTVVLLEYDEKRVVLDIKKEWRSFPAKNLWRLSNGLEVLKFIKRLVRIANNEPPIPDQDTPTPSDLYDDARILGWFIVSLIDGRLKKSFFDKIRQAIKEKGLIKDKPPQFQELVDALYRTLK
ncbi:MAG: hypothetical protein Q8P63_00705 [Candidatus Nealsonbacteria bacterium]|nr:hypothetical protein [Candidatus Nealsonbacteria bacterium]